MNPTKSPAKPGKKESTLSIFDSELNKLNDAQKKAVETIEGPVMVIAGPGTGKTQTLAMRVANILTKTHMRPSNILCLTFSVSGATAMRERLRLLIGADAYGVTVSTIHGFCQSIIDTHPEVFEEFCMKEQISEIEKYQELNSIIDDVISGSKLLNPKDPYGRDGDILSRISQIKREGKSVEDLKKALKEFEGEMLEKNTRARTESGKKKNLAAVEKFANFIEIFKRYQEMLNEKGKYDYEDMILFALKALKEEDWLLASYQERYQYILVDEAQDTNGAQWAVIETLTTFATLKDEPNLFVVGDDDQAIYRFQGANLTNMLKFTERFPRAPVIALNISYRSTQTILTAAQNLIEKNEERLVGKIKGLTKDLEAFTKEKGEQPKLLRSPSDSAEGWLIADLIEERIKKGIPAKEIAVLTQTNLELFPLFDVLRARKIPVLLRGKTDLLQHPLVTEALSILHAIIHLESNSALTAAISSSAFQCHPADVSRLLLLAREEKKHLHDVLIALEHSEAPFIRKDEVIKARDVILDLAHNIENRTVLETVERTLHLLTDTERDPLDLAAIEVFFHYTKDQCLKKSAQNFRGFLRNIEFYADPEFGQARLTFELPHLVTEGVQLMTAHQSKGLEFHTVILTNFRDGHWDKRRKPGSVAIPEEILFAWGSDQKKFEQHQDERRVAFVAFTRAKRELIFTCPKELSVGEKHKPVSPSAFFAEAGTLPEEEVSIKDPERASTLLLRPVRKIDAELEAYLHQRLEHFSLSATSLGRFLKDPQEFLLIDLLGQPEHFDEGAARRLGYGSSVHYALNEWGIHVGEKDFNEKKFLAAFELYLNEKTILTQKQKEDLLNLGSVALPTYFKMRLQNAKPIIYSLERNYVARLGDIPIKGKIDRIDRFEPDSARVTVIDYKTGAAKSEREVRGALEPGEISKTQDGQNFRQLAFYSLLLGQADSFLKPEVFALEFIGERGEDPERVEFAVNEQERKALHQLITDVWTKIQALDFTPLQV